MSKKFYRPAFKHKKNKRLILFNNLDFFFKTFREGNMIDFDLIGCNAISS